MRMIEIGQLNVEVERLQRQVVQLRAEATRATDAMAAMMKVFMDYYREEELIANRDGPQIGDADPEPKP